MYMSMYTRAINNHSHFVRMLNGPSCVVNVLRDDGGRVPADAPLHRPRCQDSDREAVGEDRVRYPYRRLYILLRRAECRANHKKVYRLHIEEGLSIRTRSPRCRRACRYRSGRTAINAMNDRCAMDFMSDRLFDGRSFIPVTIVDCHTREALGSCARITFRAFQVVAELDPLARHGRLGVVREAGGTPQRSGVCWPSPRPVDVLEQEVELDFFRPGKPTDNAFIEAFNSRLLENRSGMRRIVVALRQRGGCTLTRTFLREAEGVGFAKERIAPGSTLSADEVAHRDLVEKRSTSAASTIPTPPVGTESEPIWRRASSRASDA